MSTAFENAMEQLHKAGKLLNLDPNILGQLESPQRLLKVSEYADLELPDLASIACAYDLDLGDLATIAAGCAPGTDYRSAVADFGRARRHLQAVK